MTINQLIACMVMQGFKRKSPTSIYYKNPEYYETFIARGDVLIFGDKVIPKDTTNTVMIESLYNYIQKQLRRNDLDKQQYKETNANSYFLS